MRLCSLGVLLIAGCKGDGDDTSGPDDGVDAAVVSVSPTSITFDTIELLGSTTTAEEIITISNTGSKDLKLTNVYVGQGQQSFEVTPLDGLTTLEPDDSIDVTVTFAPMTAYEHTGKVQVESNDHDDPVVSVNLVGEAIAPSIEVDPVSVMFDADQIGCERSDSVFVRNVGNDVLSIEDIGWVSDSDDLFAHIDAIKVPYAIAAGDQLAIDIEHVNWDDLNDSAQLTIFSNDLDSPEVMVDIDGDAPNATLVTDSYTQAANTDTDWLFVVDNTSGMSAFQDELETYAEDFVKALDAAGTDYRMAVITTDASTHVGGWWDSTDDDPAAELGDQVTLGEGGGDTKGLEMVYDCLQKNGDCEPGGGFLRNDATFATVFLTDGTDDSTLDATAYYNAYVSAKGGDTAKVRLHAIAGTSLSKCADAGIAYEEAVTLSGGHFADICDVDWSDDLETMISLAVPDTHTFALSDLPVADTIEVHVAGKKQTKGWTYEGGENVVIFDNKAAPKGGSAIDISYYPAVKCGG